MITTTDFDRRVAARVHAARVQAGLTLDALAERSGVSRAMISKVERAETSATAALLNRLCSGLGITLGSLFVEDGPVSPVARRADQAEWRDPASGYLRRSVSPNVPQRGFDIVDVTFPAGERVAFDPWRERGAEQQVWVLDGTLHMTANGADWELGPGDCLHMTLDQPVVFENRGVTPVRYAVVIAERR